jgi:hypothetical protein
VTGSAIQCSNGSFYKMLNPLRCPLTVRFPPSADILFQKKERGDRGDLALTRMLQPSWRDGRVTSNSSMASPSSAASGGSPGNRYDPRASYRASCPGRAGTHPSSTCQQGSGRRHFHAEWRVASNSSLGPRCAGMEPPGRLNRHIDPAQFDIRETPALRCSGR